MANAWYWGRMLFTAPRGVQPSSFGRLALLVRRLHPQYQYRLSIAAMYTSQHLVFRSFVASFDARRSVLAINIASAGSQNVLTCTSFPFKIYSSRDILSLKARLWTIHKSVSRLFQETSCVAFKNMESILVSFIPKQIPPQSPLSPPKHQGHSFKHARENLNLLRPAARSR